MATSLSEPPHCRAAVFPGDQRPRTAGRGRRFTRRGGFRRWPHKWWNEATMELGVRALKGGERGVIKRASRGEEVVVTARGRPVARIVAYQPGGVPPAHRGPGGERRNRGTERRRWMATSRWR
jgi:prevent-host-death family protein